MNANSVMSMILSTTTKVENEKSTQLPRNHNSTIMFHKSFLFNSLPLKENNTHCKSYSTRTKTANKIQWIISHCHRIEIAFDQWQHLLGQRTQLLNTTFCWRMPVQYSRCYANRMQCLKVWLLMLRQQWCPRPYTDSDAF